MDKVLTIFYNKRTGKIKELCSGKQSFDWFGDEAQDYEQIFDFVIVEFDEYILENYMTMEIVDRKLRVRQKEEEEVPNKYR